MRHSTIIVAMLSATLISLNAPLVAAADRGLPPSQSPCFELTGHRQTIAACMRLIRSRRSSAQTRAQALQWHTFNRALHYLHAGFTRRSGNAKGAIRDLTRAMRVARSDEWSKTYSLFLRANLHLSQARYRQAIADASEVFRRQPQNAEAYRLRGLAHWLGRQESAARRDFDRATVADPKDLTAMLWLFTVSVRPDRRFNLGELADASGLDLSVWPGPVVRRFLGQIAAEEMMSAASAEPEPTDTGSPPRAPVQRCQAQFFEAQFALSHDAKDEAAPWLEHVVARCRAMLSNAGDWLNWLTARVELNAIKINSVRIHPGTRRRGSRINRLLTGKRFSTNSASTSWARHRTIPATCRQVRSKTCATPRSSPFTPCNSPMA